MQSTRIKLITLRELVDRLGISKSAVYRRLDPQEKLYDPSFPRPIKIGQNSSRWIEAEIETWLQTIISEQREAT